jgi:hypothetical protein
VKLPIKKKKKKRRKKGLVIYLSGRTPAYHMQGIRFNPQHCNKKIIIKKKKRKEGLGKPGSGTLHSGG